MAHVDTKAKLIGGVLWTAKRWPTRAPNPGKFRWAVYRDGRLVGGARTLVKVWELVERGWWD